MGSAHRNKPVVGGALGALAAIAIVTILQHGGIVPAERLVVFGILGLGVSSGACALSSVRSLRLRPDTRTTAGVHYVAVALVVFGLTGIPSFLGHGDVSGGCALRASTTGTWTSPDQTSPLDPFVIAPDHSVVWEVETPELFPYWEGDIAVNLGGFTVTMWTQKNTNGDLATRWTGIEDASADLESVRDETGLTLRGVYHVQGRMRAREGWCVADAYVVIPPSTIFSGPILAWSWAGLTTVLVVGWRLRRTTPSVRNPARD
jgi:hypothetical protein